MDYFHSYLNQMATFKSKDSDLRQYMESNTLDDLYIGVDQNVKEVLFLEKVFYGNPSISPSLFTDALDNLENEKKRIFVFYENWFETHSYIGDQTANDHPDVVIVLGSRRPILDLRMNAAIPYIQKVPNAHVIFSGGGFSTIEAESTFMDSVARKAGIKNEIILEKDSMDTIGNALFSKFLMKKQNLISKIRNIVIFTSCFHSTRALHYFRSIFQDVKGLQISSKGVKTQNTNLWKVIEHELLTEHTAYSTIFDDKTGIGMDDTAILVKLIQNHQMYNNRYDLLRKYLMPA